MVRSLAAELRLPRVNPDALAESAISQVSKTYHSRYKIIQIWDDPPKSGVAGAVEVARLEGPKPPLGLIVVVRFSKGRLLVVGTLVQSKDWKASSQELGAIVSGAKIKP